MPASCHSSSACAVHLSQASPPSSSPLLFSIMHGRRKFDPPYPTGAQILGLSALLGPPEDFDRYLHIPFATCGHLQFHHFMRLVTFWPVKDVLHFGGRTVRSYIYTQLSRLLPFDLNHPLPLPLEPIHTLMTYTPFLFPPASHRHTFSTGPSSSAI